MVTTTSLLIGAIAGALVGCIAQYVIIKFGLKSKYQRIIDEAHKEAEVIKKNKLLEVKEKFLNKKAELEKEISQRNNKIQQAEHHLKQREIQMNNATRTCSAARTRLRTSRRILTRRRLYSSANRRNLTSCRYRSARSSRPSAVFRPMRQKSVLWSHSKRRPRHRLLRTSTTSLTTRR